ncbi:MAG: hypothetical protein ABH803_04275 [Candidatus Micrarchaeota archaeon]
MTPATRSNEFTSHKVSGEEGQGKVDFMGNRSGGKKVYVHNINEHELNFNLKMPNTKMNALKQELQTMARELRTKHGKDIGSKLKLLSFYVDHHVEIKSDENNNHTIHWRLAVNPTEKLKDSERIKLNAILNGYIDPLKEKIQAAIDKHK